MPLLCILGPTASGKTRLAVNVARHVDGEILSADSRQVYRGMDIGTGKDLADLYADFRTPTGLSPQAVPCHLIDLVPAGEKYNLFRYQQDFWKAYTEVQARGKTPILCGGSGMYIEAVARGYALPDVPPSPAFREAAAARPMDELIRQLEAYGPLHNTTDIDSKQRVIRALEIARWRETHPLECAAFPPIDTLFVGIDPGRELRRERISQRLRKRLQEENMCAEVEGLLRSGIPPQDLIYYGLEYKYITQYLLGQYSLKEMVSQLEIAIHQFAKRQMTWFRGMERRGLTIHWIDGSLPLPVQCQAVLDLVSSGS